MGTGVGAALILKEIQTADGVGVLGHDIRADTRNSGSPRNEHSTPQALQTVPTAVLGAVARAVVCTANLRGAVTLTVSRSETQPR